MSCEQWRDKLDAYVDDPQTAEAAGLEEHLPSCPSCTADVLSRVQLKRATRAAATRYTPSPEFRQKVQRSIRAKRKGGRFAVWLPSLSAASVALLLIVSLTFRERQTVYEQAFAALVDLHVATLASSNPVDVVSTDRHTVKPWFQGKLPFTFNIPELSNTPYKLVGGKLVYFHDQAAAQLVLELRKHEISLFIAQETKNVFPSGEREAQENGFSVDSWTQDGLHYVIVSDASAADVHQLGTLLKAAAKQ